MVTQVNIQLIFGINTHAAKVRWTGRGPMTKFSALMVSKGETGQSVDWVEMGEDELKDGDVLVRVSHSTINYKDGLAITGKAPVIRKWPMIPGVDLAGTVESSSHDRI